MEKFSKRCGDVTDHGHCIIKEELIISDSDEEIDVEKVDKEIYSNRTNVSLSDSHAQIEFDKHSKSNGTLASRKSVRLRNKNFSADKKKQTTIDLFEQSENVENNDEQSEISTDSTKIEKPIVAVTTNHDIDTLAKKVAKAYCKKCKKKSEVVRHKSRCEKCKTHFSYTCHTCDTTYSTFSNLGFHLKVKHIEAHLTYPCSICGLTYTDNKKLMVHRNIKHNIYESLICSKCGKKFKRSVNKIMHEKFCSKDAMSESEQTNLYKCDKCFYTTRQKKRLKSHTLEKHTEGFKAECKNCPKVFKTQRSLRRHAIHYCNKPKPLECDHCGHKFYRKDQIILHIDQSHMIGYYSNSNTKENFQRTRICKFCGVTLGPSERLKYHRTQCKSALESRLNSQPCKREPRICKYCGETMKPHEHMRYHVERCESAPLALRYTTERAKLPDIDTAMEKLAISYCVKCQTKKPLKDQEVRHCSKCNKLLRFACVSCPKNFVDTIRLLHHLQRNHVRTLKFYRCDKCRCSYNRKRNLMKHLRDCHSDQPRTTDYKCEKCGKEYKSKNSLRNHKVSCGQEPKFHCDKCPYKTHYKFSIINHIWAKRGTCI